MFINTNGLMREVRDAFLWQTDPAETEGEPMHMYNYGTYAEDFGTLGKADLTLARLFVWHDFHDGYIWAYYSYAAYDNAGELITGSRRILTKWKIHKEGGKWEIVGIFEEP